MGEPVILLHGLWLRGFALWPLARRLARAGFVPEIFDYPSVRGGPEPAIARLAARLAEHVGVPHLVGHSLGGLIALETLRRHPGLPVRRVVCLGSPLAGSSAAARGQARLPALLRLLGASPRLIVEGIGRWEGRAEVGVVAGALAWGMGRVLGRFDGPHDGTVAVAETRIPGLADHRTIRCNHTGLLLAPAAARLVAAFLREGRFGPLPAG